MNAFAIEAVFRREANQVLATLIRLLRDFDLAQEARQEAFAAAIEQWPTAGIPDNPRAWLIHIGRNKGIDAIRRRTALHDKLTDVQYQTELEAQFAPLTEADDAAFGDDCLRLIFTCCHPALNIEAQVALTLQTICDLTTAAVARAFLVSETTMAQRLVRAKKKIREANIPYETPAATVLDERVDGVLTVIYLVFTEGYAVTVGAELVREELCREAIRLGRLLDVLLPNRAEVKGLLALMLLHDARRKARVTSSGDIVLLEDQDHGLWDQTQIAEGLVLVEQALRTPLRVHPYAVQAAIAALHAQAPHHDATDWPQIVGLYEVLIRLQPTPVIELNHAVAVAMVDGPARALALLDSLDARHAMADYHLFHAARANLLQRLARNSEAADAYRAALAATKVEPERRLLERRLHALT